jgi:hypothetical protein
MAIKVALQNPQTKEIRQVKVGWSWVLFLFSGFFGIPFFLRKLKSWAYLFLGFNIVYIVATLSGSAIGEFVSFVDMVADTAFLILIGVKGNEITAKTWLAEGWQFVDPSGDATKFAKTQWGIADQPQPDPPVASGPIPQT